MSGDRCALCWRPVSAHNAELNDDGELCHPKCLHPSPEQRVLDSLLGPNYLLIRRNEALAIMASERGHKVRWLSKKGLTEEKPWECTCGRRGTGMTEKRNHLKDVAMQV